MNKVMTWVLPILYFVDCSTDSQIPLGCLFPLWTDSARANYICFQAQAHEASSNHY